MVLAITARSLPALATARDRASSKSCAGVFTAFGVRTGGFSSSKKKKLSSLQSIRHEISLLPKEKDKSWYSNKSSTSPISPVEKISPLIRNNADLQLHESFHHPQDKLQSKSQSKSLLTAKSHPATLTSEK